MNGNCTFKLRSVKNTKFLLVFTLLFTNFYYLFAQSPQEKVTSYLKNTSAYYGLKSGDMSDFEITSHHVSSVSGIQHIYFTQRYAGISIFTTESSAHFQNTGSLFTANNLFISDLKESIQGDGTPDLTPVQAIEKVSAELGYQQLGNLFVMQYLGGKEQKSIIARGQISIEDIPVKLKYFPFRTRSTVSNSTVKDNIVLAWEMYIYEPNQLNYWHILADATTGKILFKNNLVVNCGFGDAHHSEHCNIELHEEKSNKYSVPAFPTPAMVGGYRVYAMPIESPGHGSRTLVLNPDNALASPFGWHDTNGAAGPEFTITRGNNTHSYEDGNNPGFSPDGGGGLTFDYPINTVYTMGVDESEPAAITNLFYWTNIIHDVIYQYGFTEAAGNFQVNNYGRGGTGNDDVMAEAQDGSGTCNANFATPIEGNRPRMQMYVCGNRDGDLDNAVIIHEYGHGISIRLTGGPFNSSCLNNQEQPGEGWSDWYGLMLTMRTGDAGPNSRGIGTWLFGQPPTGPGIRQYPYSTNLAVNPHTYDNIKTAAVPHGVGSVWCAMLWEVTWDLIAQYGFDPNFYTGNGGNNRALKLVTEALKLQPCSPGFVDARNAILKADTVLYNAQNACLIWKAFAKRGLGYSALQASSGSRSDGTQAFDIPPACMAQAPQTVCFDFTGGMQTWIVPAGVTSVTIEANGAEGATAPSSINVCGGSPDRGGRGGLATGTLAVTPGETLNIFVGQKGFNGPGNAFNGGGSGCNDPSTCSGGGGASDVRKGGSGLANRVIVAGGGGGAEFSCGNQGGGAGGGLVGSNGLGGDCSVGDATGGTQVGGGIGGNGPACGWPSGGGQSGTLGQGGNSSLVAGSSLHSGAGGGGYYGGGAGSVDGHGGGGSSYLGGVTGGSTTSGVNLGNGRVCITFGAANGTGPSITCPANVTVGCAIDIPAVNIGAPRVSNGTCQGTLVVTHRKDSITDQTCPNRYNVHRIYRVTDPCGNFAECIQLIVVNDVTAPSVVCPAPVNVQCASAVPPVNTGSVITADHCGNVGLVVTHVGDVITNRTCVNRFTITRTYRSTDACGNSGTCSQVITVFDNTVPLVVCRNITVNLDEAGNAIITPSQITQSVSDNCTPNALLVVTASRTAFTCANIGPNNVTLSTTDECGNVGTCLAVVTVVDNLPPMIMGCPTKSPITINLGPGECEASWDAPPFMAMDNCPAGAYFGNRNTTTVCLPPASYWSITGGAASWGVMFDLINTSGSLLNLQLLGERAFANVPHNIYYTTNPGGHAPVVATPNAWTLCATRTPTSGAQFTTVIDSFRLLTGTRTDTIKRCAPIQTETTVLGCLTMAPGETRGIYIHAPGTGGTNASLFSGCGATPMGDANIRTPLDGATYTGGQFAAPFINSSFGFGGANWMGVIGYNLANSNRVPLVQTCGAPYGPGCFFPIGCTKLCYRATDASGNVGTCEFEVCVNKYANPTRALACNDDIQISLDDSCRATIYPDMVLEGGPYSCYDDYIVEVRDWKGGPLIDREPNRRGVQINGNDIGRELKITIIDPVTGNSCWGHGRVEDKLAPKISCPLTNDVSCGTNTDPGGPLGLPSVEENCGGYSLTYRDLTTNGNCEVGYSKIIQRTWIAIDGSGNRSECIQSIRVKIGDLFEVTVPANYDNLDQAALECDEKIDRNKNVTPHMSDFPECVDGYILDSAYWLANPNAPDQYPNRRLPRVLGWNCIDDVNDPHYGHPSPDPVYYPQHRQWSPNNPLCWGPDRHIMWVGTGRPGGAECSNLTVTYKDIVFDLATPGCDAGPVGCFKVLRQWTVMDWCTSQVGGHNQIIKVIDDEGPQVLYPDSARVNMESWTCTGRWEVPAPWILDNCSNEVHYTVEVDNGTVLGDETAGFVVLDMPEGIYNGYIVATDCCGNITKKRIVLNVIDRVPPQAVCRTATVVSLNGNQSPLTNYARLHAEDLDEGSFDNCQPHVYFKVIRMAELLGTNNGSNSNNVVACEGRNGDDNSILAGNQIYFDDYTDFCCADVGTKVMVVLRVFDVDPGAGPVTPIRMTSTSSVLNGRFSDCMVEVEVQNKAVPTVIAPPNIVVSCWFWFDVTKLTNPNDATFGKVVTSLTDRRKVVTKDLVCYKFCERNDYTGYPGYVQTNAQPKPAPNQACEYYYQYFDTAHWDRKYELVWGFDGYVLSPCGSTPTITVNDLRECGQGVIQRIISTTGPNNINVTAIQTIWVVDCDPFYIDDVACNDPRYTDLLWPNGMCTQTPVTLDGCGADISPDNPQLGRPQVINNADDNCALLSIEYFDEQFNIEPDACFKVLRRWVVIDWCQYDPFIDPDHGRWEALQVIKVRDQNRPVVSCNVGPCEPAKIDSKLGVCVGHISLTASATDNCTPADWLFWEYKIDAFNDGKGVHGGYDFRVGTLTSKQYAAGDTVEFSHNPFADDSHNPFNASGTYPIGIHKIKWFVEDGCGNVGVCESLFEIKDCKAPTPYCLTGVITVPMPSSGCVDIWAKDLDKGSYDNCTSQENLKFYFDEDPTKPSLTVCCQDFVDKKLNDEIILEVELWVEDEEGNKDYCKTIIVIQDNQNICPNVGSAKGKISGNIKTETGVETRPVEVSLFHNGSMMRQMMGSPYSFGDLVMNTTYSVKPERNDEHANGVTTQDIVKIQKHILGQSEITDPYKLLAADVNASKTITASDMAELRKLILGINSEFRNVKSWTFVPADYVFADPKSPWDAPRSADLMLDHNRVMDFVSVKMGDVTGDSRANGAQGIQSRTNGKLSFEIKDQEVVAGESYRVSFKSSDFRNISGYQFTLKFDQSSLIYEGTESGVLKTTEANFGTKRVSEGMLTTSWNADKGLSYGKEDELFVINFTATRNGMLSKMMAVNSNITSAQAYDEKENLLEPVMGVRTDRGIVESGVFELYQNEPNPFSKETVVSYRLPESGAVKLTVYDVTGKVLRVYELKGQKGLNHHQISKGDLNATGVLYYQLDAADHTATKKMVSIE